MCRLKSCRIAALTFFSLTNWKSTRKMWGQQFDKISADTLIPFDYAIWGVLENKTNSTSYPNIASLKTATDGQKNKMYLFGRHALCFDTIFKKKFDRIESIYYFVPIFLFYCLCFQSKLILFYDRVVYHYTRTVLTGLPRPVYVYLFISRLAEA